MDKEKVLKKEVAKELKVKISIDTKELNVILALINSTIKSLCSSISIEKVDSSKEIEHRDERLIGVIFNLKKIKNEIDPWKSRYNEQLHRRLSSIIDDLGYISKDQLLERVNGINKIINEILSILSWEWIDNYGKSALGYDKATETILIDEERLMNLIQLINPAQKRRNIKIVKGLMDNSFKESLQEQQREEISNGSKTLNKIRKDYGLEPLEGGDTLTTKL